MILTAISGGIGSGKSVVARMLRAMGYEVYDCDVRAREIMDIDEHLRRRIACEVCSEAVEKGQIDRRRLAEKVFSDSEALERLNRIVHGAVKDDISRWASTRMKSRAFIETAILYQSGIDRMVDEVWEVTAPSQLRLKRAVGRGMNEMDAQSRMAMQDAYDAESVHRDVKMIVNDDIEAVIPQILSLLSV